jgi:hypothetical protein
MAYSLVNLLPLSLRSVFSHIFYITLSTAIALTFWIIFNLFEQLIFFWPVWVFYLPEDALLGFVVTTIIAILLGILISMNIYVIRNSRLKITKSSLFSGTGLSILSSTCVSCSSIGFLLISTFGGLGIVISNFLSTYQLPLRILSIAVLLFALYSIHKRITKNCVVNFDDIKKTNRSL